MELEDSFRKLREKWFMYHLYSSAHERESEDESDTEYREETNKRLKTKYDELSVKDPTKKGMFMASIMKDLKGKADGALVKSVVDSLFI